jgi:RimJ/RimL family protein N-acetyltransferase
MGMKIRKMQGGDVLALHKIINEPEIIEYMPLPRPVPRKRVERWFELCQKTHDPDIFVIDDGGIVGCISLKKDGIVSLWIRAGSQNKGYGTHAMDWVIDHARKKRMKKLCVRCFVDNEKAIDFYEYMGFEDVGQDRGMLVMELEI